MLCALFSVLACIIIVVGIRVATSKDTKHKKSVETSAKSGKAKIDTSGVEVKKLVIDTEEVKDKSICHAHGQFYRRLHAGNRREF